MFWDEKCRNEEIEENRQIQIMHNIIIKKEFLKKFSIVVWNDMIKQCEWIETDDNCTHYMDKQTKYIYSWDLYEEKWLGPFKPHERNHDDLKSMFP